MSTEELERIARLRRILALVRERQKKAIHASGNRLSRIRDAQPVFFEAVR
jgi:hypothetical protein